jgi:sugar phosphate isomerase/epimerase
MNTIKLGLIGILGEQYQWDFWGTAQKVADLGYQGIECPDALLDGDVNANLKRFRDLGLSVLGIGSGLDDLLPENLPKLVEKAVKLQAPKVSMWWSTCETKDQILRESELYNEAGRVLGEHGIKFCYHNHWQEFKNSFDGVYALDLIAANTDPKLVSFELDICWIKAGGEDPSRVLTRYAPRIPAIHVKDYVEVDGKVAFTALGTGIVDVQACVRTAISLGIEWAIVEQDTLRHLAPLETAAFCAYFFKESELIPS